MNNYLHGILLTFRMNVYLEFTYPEPNISNRIIIFTVNYQKFNLL